MRKRSGILFTVTEKSGKKYTKNQQKKLLKKLKKKLTSKIQSGILFSVTEKTHNILKQLKKLTKK